MNKLYLSLFITLSSSVVTAQTIDQSDLPFAGLAWISGVDTTYSEPVPPGGAAQSWDFSSLQYDYLDTVGFLDAAGTPYASIFPGANLAAPKLSTGEWTYFTASATGFYLNGYVNDTITIIIDPRQMYTPVPFSYGNTHTDVSRVVIDTTFLTYDAQVRVHFNALFEADGYGTLITPTATYPSTLRVKETILETDSFLIDYLGTGNYTLVTTLQTQQTIYRWYQHGGTANFLLGLEADSLGTTATQSEYLIQWAVVGVEDVKQENKLLVYSNQSGELVIKGSVGIQAVRIFNSTGQQTKHKISGNKLQEAAVDIHDLATGIYFYSISTADGKHHNGKFSIAR